MYLSVTLQVQYSQLSIKQNKRYNTIYKLIKQTYSINTHLPKDNIAAILTKYTWYFVLNTKPLFYSFFVLSGHNMLSRIQFRRRSMFKCILSKYWTQGLSIDISWTGIRALLSAPILFDRQGRQIWHLFWEEKRLNISKHQIYRFIIGEWWYIITVLLINEKNLSIMCVIGESRRSPFTQYWYFDDIFSKSRRL